MVLIAVFAVAALILATIGVATALILTRFMGTLLYGVAATDVPTYLAATGGIAIVALAASYVPARRANTVDPATSLRAE